MDSNRKINNAKRAKVDAGNAALKHVKNVVETGSVGGVEKVAEMQALIDTAPISVPRAQPKETDGPEPAPSRSRDRTTATTVTKTAKSRNRPTLREKKTASRSARVTQEKTRTKEAIIDEDDIDAIGSPDLSTQYAVPTGAQWKQGMGTHQPQGYQPTVWNAGHSIHQPSAAGNHLVGYVSASNFNHGEVQTQNNHVLRNASGVNSTMYGSHNQGSYAANNGYPSTELNYHHSLMPGTFPQEFPLNGQNNWELGHTSSSATTTAAATAPMHWSTTTNGNFPQGTLSSVPIMVPTSDGIYLPNISYTATPNHHNDTAAQDYNGVKYTDEY